MSHRSHQLLFALGRPLSPLYSGLMAWRAHLYRRGVLKVHRLPVPVISIGNLTMGGTGKTPCVMAVARLLLELGRRPAVVSRGYHGLATDPVNVVSDGRRVLLDARLAGDEPHLLAQSLRGVPVLTGKKRPLAARRAVEDLGADIVLLDDGFQHLALARDLDLVLIKVPAFLDGARVFPGGELREPLGALHRAHGFILTGLEERYQDGAARFSAYLRQHFPGRPVFRTAYATTGLLDLAGGGPVDPAQAQAHRFCAFCGLADPNSFRATLARQDLRVLDFQAFPDHHAYSPRDLADLVARARHLGGDALLTTEKDLVKLRDLAPDLPVFALRVRFDLGDDFRRFLTAALQGPTL